MEFSIKPGSPEKQRSNCVVVGVFEGGKLSDAAKTLDITAKHALSDAIGRGDITGKTGTTLLLHKVLNIVSDRVLLVGLGKQKEFDEKRYQDAIRSAMRALFTTGAKDAIFYLSDWSVSRKALITKAATSKIDAAQQQHAWCLTQAVLVAEDVGYRFDQMKSIPEKTVRLLSKIHFGMEESAPLKKILEQAIAIAQGVKLTKDLGNLPGNICTPTYLADQAKTLAKVHKLKVTVLEEKDMEKLGMHSLLSVTRGSRQPAKLITLEYAGGDKKSKPIVLVGKGITFDSGGISLKPGADMDEMKYDMCGAASVLGTMQAIAQMGLKLNVIGVIPSCENMPDGAASKPGDIVTSMSGQTIEILNTDAEGRLILCDALTYVAKFEPDTVVDIATLTGACVIALGHVATGLFSNEDKLASALLEAGNTIHDRAWHMPLWDDYQQQLDSNFADMQNIGGRAGGSITAACFLSRFTKDYRWAHLDIAGTAWKSGKEKGATGRPVPLLTQYLINRAQ